MKEIYANVESESDIYSTFGGPGDLNGEFVDYVIGKLKDSEKLDPVQLIFQSREPMDEQRVRDSISMWIKNESMNSNVRNTPANFAKFGC